MERWRGGREEEEEEEEEDKDDHNHVNEERKEKRRRGEQRGRVSEIDRQLHCLTVAVECGVRSDMAIAVRRKLTDT